jgi:hypothetical protein
LKMGIPKDGVKHKMKSDQVDSKIVEAVFAVDSGTDFISEDDSKAKLTSEEEEIASKYRRMLKMGIPKDGVKHKMTRDQVDSKIVEAVLTVDIGAGSASVDTSKAQLTSEEEEVASKYRRMLKMGIPKDGVKHKMKRDQVNSKIVEAVLAVDSGTDIISEHNSESKLTSEEEEIAGKYRRMLKMGIPKDGVKHKMKSDQVDSKIVEAVFAVDSGTDFISEDDSKAKLTSEEEEIADKYRKMLKMGIPKGGVTHKMMKDQIDAKIVEAVLGSEKDDSSTSAKHQVKIVDEKGVNFNAEEEASIQKYQRLITMHVPKGAIRQKMIMEKVDAKIIVAVLGEDTLEASMKEKETLLPILTSEENAIAEKYRKSLKLLLSKDAVRHKMMRENVSAKIIDAVLGSEDTTTPKSKPKSVNDDIRRTAAKSNLVGLHWTPLSPKALESSVWGTQMKNKLLTPGDSEILELEKFFQKKKIMKTPMKEGNVKGDGAEHKLAKLIDLTRANNISISLKAFKEFSLSELVAIIADLDPDKKIAGERTQNIKQLLPHQQELLAVKSYNGDDSALVPAEVFFRHLLNVKRPEAKFHVMQVMNSFSDVARETEQKFDLLSNVCNQVLKSERLKRILENVLIIGNKLNEGTRTGGVAGFKFESLLKLTQTKSSDGKMTVLDYLVRTFVNRKERHLLALASEFPDSQEASKINISETIGELRLLQKSIGDCDKELELMKKDQRGGLVGSKIKSTALHDKLQVPDLATARNDLLHAIQQRKDPTLKKDSRGSSDQRAGFLAELKCKKEITVEERRQKECNCDGDKDLSGFNNCVSLEEFTPGVKRLENFLVDSKRILEAVKGKEKIAIESCRVSVM